MSKPLTRLLVRSLGYSFRRTWVVCVMMVLASAMPAQPLENSLLWRISGKKLRTPSYLFGTMHLLCPEDLALPAKVSTALQASQQLVLELDMDDPSLTTRMQRHLMSKTMTDTVSLPLRLTSDDYQALEQLTRDSLGMSTDILKRLNPMMVEIMLLPRMMGCTPASVEVELMELLKKTTQNTKQNKTQNKEPRKEILGLETVEKQLSYIDKTSMNEQVSELVKLIRDVQSTRQTTKRLGAFYKAEQLDSLTTLLREMPGGMAATLVTERNRAWIPTIEKFISRKASFIAVGAGHLPSESGIITLLRKKGYTVEAVLNEARGAPARKP